MKRLHQSQRGFTVVELMIATAVFSVVLLLCSMAILHVGKMYYKGVITNRTQDAARRIAEDVTGAIQFGAAAPDTNSFRRVQTDTSSFGIPVESLCLGDVRYSYSRTRYVGQVAHVLWRDRWSGSGCPPVNITAATPSANGVSMLGTNMRLPKGITANPSGQLWQVDLQVSYGDDPQLFVNPANFEVCKGVSAGGQFCATASFRTNVVKRL